jgi:ABC-2 type transport system ATP-binding protein
LPQTSSPPAIEVQHISKQIKHQTILDNVTLTVPTGEMYGIRGHNGAGKSMLFRVICGLVKPDSGSVKVFGQTIGKEVEFPPDVGALIDSPGFLPNYSGFHNLKLLAMIRHQITDEEISATMRLVGLDPQAAKPVKTYSTGMRQRLAIAQAIMEKPRLLLLDEPTNGLDREGVQAIHHLLVQLKNQGITILLASHNKEELETLCQTIVWMDRGQLLHDEAAQTNF